MGANGRCRDFWGSDDTNARLYIHSHVGNFEGSWTKMTAFWGQEIGTLVFGRLAGISHFHRL